MGYSHRKSMRDFKHNWHQSWEDYASTTAEPPSTILEKEDMSHGQEWFSICERYAIHRTNIIKTDCSGVFALWDREAEVPVGYIGASVYSETMSVTRMRKLTPKFSATPFATLHNFDLAGLYTQEYNDYVFSGDLKRYNFEGLHADDLSVWMLEFDPVFLATFHNPQDQDRNDFMTLRDILMGVYSLLVADFGFASPQYRLMRWNSVAHLNIKASQYQASIRLNAKFQAPTQELMDSVESSPFVFPCITSLDEDIYFVNDISAVETSLYEFNYLNVYDKDMTPIGRIGYAYLYGNGTYLNHKICVKLPAYMTEEALDAIRRIDDECEKEAASCLAIWKFEMADDYTIDKDTLCSRIIQAIRMKVCQDFDTTRLVLDEDSDYLVGHIPAIAPVMRKSVKNFADYLPDDESALLPLDSTVLALDDEPYNGRYGYITVSRRFDLSSGDIRVYAAEFYDAETNDVVDIGMFSAYVGLSDGIYPQFCDFKGRIDMGYASALGSTIASLFPEPEEVALVWMVQLSKSDAETARLMRELIDETMSSEAETSDYLCSKSPCLYLFNDSIVSSGYYVVSPEKFLGRGIPGDKGSLTELHMPPSQSCPNDIDE